MDEEEYQDAIVYMDFSTKVEDSFFSDNKEFKIIGLDTKKPVLQLGNQIFQGEWKDTIGTNMFFEEVEEAQQNIDPLFEESSDKTMRFCFKTDKLLQMSRIFVKPKSEYNTCSEMKESLADDVQLDS